MRVLVTFNHTCDALEAESLAKNKQLKARLIPIPESIEASCGLSLRVEVNAKDEISDILDNYQIIPNKYYEIINYSEYEQL